MAVRWPYTARYTDNLVKLNIYACVLVHFYVIMSLFNQVKIYKLLQIVSRKIKTQ